MSDSNSALRDSLEEYTHETYTPADKVTATRWVEIAKNKWKIERKDPYGFWFISSPDRAPLPVKLSGKYTNAKDCQRAIEHYVNTQVLEPDQEAPQSSKIRRRKVEIPAVESVEMIA